MSVGAWEPENQQEGDAPESIDRAQLERFIHALQQGDQLRESLSLADQGASALMRLPATQWLQESESWQDDQLWELIRFFTLAEAQLPGWDGGPESPVIPLAKTLRRRKAPLSREQLLWIREHSDNRYLPYGPL
ncbi:hypothetical protein [Microbulbifer yueqingensis]|uniref:Uncharacterized protein n=1 Tax=Microbulbifer yueqingensis TaxID=658219 RepID=A0A1G8XRI0_9GAMM|nr:hypothetical protein [Microbulbifer yueqingensis]SDJ93181.1 hypothetical protein SAMN05216212_1212 [Microbulbifer yueqingensis]